MTQYLLADSSKIQLKDGQECDQLEIRDDQAVHVVTFSNEPPIPLNLTLSSLRKMPAGVLPTTLTARFSDWTATPSFDDDAFQNPIPLDAIKIESVRDLFDKKRSRGPDPLLGQAAPTFTLQSLDGGKADLGLHLGKRVIVLNFWTTWSGAFRRTAPIVERIRDEFEERDVLFLAINVKEAKEVVQYYASNVKLKLGTVVLDSNGSVAGTYGITGFPRSVVINKGGIVDSVFRGFSSDLELKLRSSLEEVLNADKKE